MTADRSDRGRWWGGALLAVAAAILAHQLLLPPIVGLADNGDFSRVLDHFGLAARDAAPEDRYFLYVFRVYGGAPPSGRRNLSSEILLAGIARLISLPFSERGTMDLRWIGALHALGLLGAGVVLWKASRRLPIAARAAPAAFAVFAFTDVGYAAPLNSFYTQAASLVFLFWIAAFAAKSLEDGRRHAWPVVGYFAAALLFVASKPQEAAQSVPLAAFGVWLAYRPGLRRIGAAGAVLLFAAAAALYAGTRGDAGFQEDQLYKIVFSEILPRSPDPRGDLAALGLDPAAVRYSGTTTKGPDSPFRKPGVRESIFPKLGYGTLFRFYLKRPARAAAALRRWAPAGLELRADFGNFEKSAGFRPGARSSAYSAWTKFRLFGRRHAAFVLALVFGANIVLAAFGRLPPPTRISVAALLVTGVLAYAICTLSSSPLDMSRKLYVFHAITDLMIAVDVGCVAWATSKRLDKAPGGSADAQSIRG
ncbi:MAG TPA: hypothetical protein VFS34_01370 [Thermoanaerobaculia bacterium]|nr:hypothetical protein [Thermoanaerobaculia bacterium]